jgi:hypothetical protein
MLLKHKFLKVCIDLQSTLPAEAHLPEGQRLEEQLNMEKLCMFREETLIWTICRAQGQHLARYKHLLKPNL